MSILRTIILLSLATAIFSCGGSEQKSEGKDSSKAKEAMARIAVMEDTLREQLTMDRRSAHELIDVYKAYAVSFPLDTMAPEYLFRAAGVHNNLGQHDKSIILLDRIAVDYPGWSRLAYAYYFKAHVLDDGMGQKGEAQTVYQFVVNNFKEHELAEQARLRLENLHMSDAEFLDMARRKELEDAGSVAR